MKVVKLSVHKNNKKQREAKEFRKHAISNFKSGVNREGVIAYAYIAWDKTGEISTGYCVPDDSPFPVHSVPEVSKMSLTERILRE